MSEAVGKVVPVNQWLAAAPHAEVAHGVLDAAMRGLFTHVGNGKPVVSDDLIEQAMEAEDAFMQTSLGPHTVTTLRRLAELAPRTLAVMHGSSYAGDGRAALLSLADRYQARLLASLTEEGVPA